MTDLSHKYFKYENFYFKTGSCTEQENKASFYFEIIDYVGKIPNSWDIDRINDKIYQRFQYSTVTKFEKIEKDIFYEKLASELMNFIVRINLIKDRESTIELNFNPTEERKALLRKIKIPLIIKETIL